MQITYGALIPLPVDEAFDFVTDPANWPTFVPMESAQALEGWGAPGGKARMVTRFLGRDVTTDLELLEWSRPNKFRYIGRNEGPDMDNSRVFEAVPGGTRLTATTTVHRGPGLSALVALVAIRRLMRRGMKELPAQAVKWEQGRA